MFAAAYAGEISLVAADGLIMDVLFELRLTYYLHIAWRELFFHESNRDGVLGSHAEVPDLMEDIRFIG